MSANLLFSAGMEGLKKYSPPSLMTHSTGRVSSFFWSFGFVPMRVRGPPPSWPLMGSMPVTWEGLLGGFGGKFGVLDQPVRGMVELAVNLHEGKVGKLYAERGGGQAYFSE